MVIAIDFDGTCVTHDFPIVGRDIGAQKVLKRLVESGHCLILYTMRSDILTPDSEDSNIISKGGNYLTAAVNWFKENEIPLFSIQTNPTQNLWTTSPKCYAEMYIDDAALGIPLIYPTDSRPYVDWNEVEKLLEERKIIQKKYEDTPQ